MKTDFWKSSKSWFLFSCFKSSRIFIWLNQTFSVRTLIKSKKLRCAASHPCSDGPTQDALDSAGLKVPQHLKESLKFLGCLWKDRCCPTAFTVILMCWVQHGVLRDGHPDIFKGVHSFHLIEHSAEGHYYHFVLPPCTSPPCGGHLAHVGWLVIVENQTHNSSVVGKLDDDSGVHSGSPWFSWFVATLGWWNWSQKGELLSACCSFLAWFSEVRCSMQQQPKGISPLPGWGWSHPLYVVSSLPNWALLIWGGVSSRYRFLKWKRGFLGKYRHVCF